MIRVHRIVQKAAGLAVSIFALAAAPAAAAPSFGVELTRDEAVVSRSDERVDYEVRVTNSAAKELQPGVTATCANGNWNGSPTVTYQWLRNGAPLESSADIANGSQSESYTVQAADAGEVLQCRITGTNAVAAGIATSIPVTAVNPLPEPAPPAGTTRPAITPAIVVRYNEVGEFFESGGAPSPHLTCTAPSGWTGSGLTWSFRWLRNGVDLGSADVVETTATTSKYELQLADRLKGMQCEAIAEDANGKKATVVSTVKPIQTFNGSTQQNLSGQPNPTALPTVQLTANNTSGTITLELELPGGANTYAYSASGEGWACEKVPASSSANARAICRRSDVLAPQASYPQLSVAAALGGDAPDLAVARATVAGGGAAAASATDEFTFTPPIPFGLTLFETGVFDQDGADYTQAGGHPFSGMAEFEFATKRLLAPSSSKRRPVEQVKQVFTDLPRGFVGNALAVPALCDLSGERSIFGCPPASAVGAIRVGVIGGGDFKPLYAIEPEFGTPAQFAFTDIGGALYTLSARLRPEDGYAVSLDLTPAPMVSILNSTATICGFGAKVTGFGGGIFAGCKKAADTDPDGPGPLTGANEKPLFANPTRCDADDPPTVRVRLTSWENPDRFAEHSFSTPAITGCELVDFEPQMRLAPSSARADSPTGLDVSLTMPTDGLEAKEGISQANLRRARVTFPAGMAVNASAAHGLGACTAEQVKLKTNLPHECPDSSKIGTVEIDTPLIQETLTGAAYIAQQGDVDGALIGLYFVFESKKDGIIVKLPAKVVLDLTTGQLTTIVDESPEAPFSAVRMHFPGGPEATLLTPPKCGTYEIKAELSSWAAGDPNNPTEEEIVTDTSSFDVTEGPGGGPCPGGGLDATLEAGSANPLAGQVSPFNIRLHRPDGSDRFTALGLKMPPGLTAYLKGVPYCPEAAIAEAKAREALSRGQEELDSPACPAASQIGRVVGGAGAGPSPFYVDTGKVYLAGPYKGAPVSVVAVVSAVAGPLDLGTIVVRNAIHVDPVTADISVVSDPILHIKHGVLLDVRDVRVLIDRPSFTLNPTSCLEKQVGATVSGLTGAGQSLANRFQVGNCAALGFKPKTRLQLFGKPGRGAYQGVRAVVRPRPGDANISRTVVRFPRSAFVAQEHIRTICTRVQFAVDRCPKGSIYGRAVAWSPLLDVPLRGNVYLRSSDNSLPDAVADLRGPAHQPIKIEVAIRNDSVKGALRNTVLAAPDAPVSYFRLQMFGKDKGLIVNSRNICRGKNRATVGMRAHNGRRSVERVKVFNRKCKELRKAAKRKAKRGAHKRGGARRASRAN